MPRSSPAQTAFNAGELSPRMLGRIDQPRYASGAERVQNFVPLVQGPLMRRSGFRFVAQTADSLPTRVIPFEVSDDEAVVLAFADQRLRFYTLESTLLDGTGQPLEIATPYLEAELFDLRFAQIVDVIYIVHRNHAPRKLTRDGPASFSLSTVSFFEGPFNAVAVDSDGENSTVTLAYNAGIAGDTITVTASADLFDVSDVGRQMRLGRDDGTNWGFGEITAFTDAQNVNVTLGRAVTVQTATQFWRLGSFKDGNYPNTITFDDQRLFLGGDPEHPQTVYASVVGDFENFTLTGEASRAEKGEVNAEVTAANAMRLTLFANNLNAVEWFFSSRALLLGTSGGLWSIQASSLVEPLQPSNAGARRSNDAGANSVAPEAVGTSVVYASPTGRRLFRAVFTLNEESFESEDISALADHLTEGGVKQMAFARDPLSILWVVTNNGGLRGVTIDAQQSVLGWHRHPVGGDDAEVESVAVIPAPEGKASTGARANLKHDQLWVVVKRTINGATFRSVEFLEDFFDDEDEAEDGFFVDSGLSYEGSAATVFSGLAHLEGEAVSILADGSEVTGKTVSGGSVTLDTAASRVHIGLAYGSWLRTLRLEAGDPAGSSQGKHKRVDHETLRFHRTRGGRVGGAGRDLRPIEFPDDILSGSPPALYTGDVTVGVNTGWNARGQIDVRQDSPLPMTLLSRVSRVESSPRGTRP